MSYIYTNKCVCVALCVGSNRLQLPKYTLSSVYCQGEIYYRMIVLFAQTSMQRSLCF